MSGRDRTYLLHIVECIDRIERYLGPDKAAFAQDVKGQDATIRNLQVLAESTRRVSQEIKAEHPDIEWDAIAGFRNVLVHDYLEVDLDEVWQVATVDLPNLKTSVEEILLSKGWSDGQESSPHPIAPSTTSAGLLPVSEQEIERIVLACRSVPITESEYKQDDYITNVFLTVLDLQMHNVVVNKSIEHYWNNRWDEVRTLSDLEGALARFPDDKEGNRELAQFLWGNNHWVRVQWLRGLVSFLSESDLTTQEELRDGLREAASTRISRGVSRTSVLLLSSG